jgi:AcrR family transcriptional regulator
VHHPVGLRERKKVETHRAIATAALALAVERGPAAVTVDDIAEAAGVSPRTVFNYFGTKEAAILGVDAERRQELVDRIESRPDGEAPLEALREALRDAAERGDSDAGGGAVAWRTRARLAREHPQLQSAYVASFTALEDELTGAVGRRTGIDPAHDPYPRLVASLALTAMRVAVDHALATESADDRRTDAIDTAIDRSFATLGAGLPQPPRNP